MSANAVYHQSNGERDASQSGKPARLPVRYAVRLPCVAGHQESGQWKRSLLPNFHCLCTRGFSFMMAWGGITYGRCTARFINLISLIILCLRRSPIPFIRTALP